MSEDTEDSEHGERITQIIREIADALEASTVTVKLQDGSEIVGPIVSFLVRKKEGKSGDIKWSGNIKVQTAPGILEIDCLAIETITPK